MIEYGARYILESYVYSREEIRRYLDELTSIWPQLDEAVSSYAAIGEAIDGRTMDDVPALVHALTKAALLEEDAMGRLRELSSSLPDPKRGVLPRWGRATPR